jgi:hypothetical protein
MHRYTFAAVVAAALVAAIPAKAELNIGPVQQNGQCFNDSAGPASGMRYGYWAPCASKASAVTTTTVKHHHHVKKS